MTETQCDLQNKFNAYAGAAYGLAGLVLADARTAERIPGKSPLVSWLLIAESFARCECPEDGMEWVKEQFRSLGSPFLTIHFGLSDIICGSWGAWLPILLLPQSDRRELFWATFQSNFPGRNEQETAVRLLSWNLLNQNGRNLFDPASLGSSISNPEKYASPQACAVIKLGLALISMQEDMENPCRELHREWADLLRNQVSKSIQHHNYRIPRGFATNWPLFEDFVLSLLAAAEWQLQPDRWRVTEFVRDVQERPEEALNENQLALAGALFGWTQGYQKAAEWVLDQSLRGVISRQALCVILHNSTTLNALVRGVDPRIMYATREGTYYSFGKPFLQLEKLDLNLQLSYQRNNFPVSRITSGSVEVRISDSHTIVRF